MEISFNENILHLKQSDIRRMTLECQKHPQGINLSQGICDLDLPAELITGVSQAIKDGYNIYTRYDGIEELRQAISQKMDYFNHIKYDPYSEITVTSGSAGAFFLALFALLEKDAEIILFQPFYGYHYNTILSLGLKAKVITLNQEDDWSIDFDLVEKMITSKTKAIVLNTPSNPSGKIFTETEIRKLAKIARDNNVFIITDEIYEFITYDGIEHISPAALDNFKSQVITIGGFSKTFSITGWRIGYLCANEEISRRIGVLNDLFYICAPAPLQKAVAEGLKMDHTFFSNLKDFYQKNRDLLVSELDKIGFKSYVPRGAYYLLADFSKLGFKNCQQAAAAILEKTGVATVPGDSFFEDGSSKGNNLLRFCFAKKYDILKQACQNLHKL